MLCNNFVSNGKFSPKSAKKHSKSTLWGALSQVPKNTQKALRGALSGRGRLGTPVHGGRDGNTRREKNRNID